MFCLPTSARPFGGSCFSVVSGLKTYSLRLLPNPLRLASIRRHIFLDTLLYLYLYLTRPPVGSVTKYRARMATTSTASSPSTLLRLPAPIRQKIYTYLLAPHADEDVTTINYTLNWNWFENPSNTTFTGLQQIDLCRCPQQHYRTHNTATEDHIYERYKCHGPKVRFKSAREDLWVLSAGYTRSGQINFLRPATEMELEWRPCGNILSTCRMVYQEAVPILYRGRNFLFLTGPCPRGRYQAYATQMFLSRLTPLVRNSGGQSALRLLDSATLTTILRTEISSK